MTQSMTPKLLICALLAVLLGSCAPPVWVKPNATQHDFAVDRYACLQEAQQQGGSAYVNAYAGVASSGSYTNGMLFNACMQARGWSLQRQSAYAPSSTSSDPHVTCNFADGTSNRIKRSACLQLNGSPVD